MRYTWEIQDIHPGRQVQKPRTGITGRYMIGYRYDLHVRPRENLLGLVSLADGMWIDVGSGIKEAIVNHLNNAGLEPVDLVLGPQQQMTADRITDRPIGEALARQDYAAQLRGYSNEKLFAQIQSTFQRMAGSSGPSAYKAGADQLVEELERRFGSMPD